MTKIWLTAAKLTCPCNMLGTSNSFARSNTVVVIDREPHLNGTCKTSLLFAPLAICVHLLFLFSVLYSNKTIYILGFQYTKDLFLIIGSLGIMFVAPSCVPLPSLFKLCPWRPNLAPPWMSLVLFVDILHPVNFVKITHVKSKFIAGLWEELCSPIPL